jgi:hypothetical protein
MSCKPQNYKNHARFDPLFHFVLLWILLFNLIFTIVFFMRHHQVHHGGLIAGWMIIMAFALLLLAFKARTYSLKVQDRIIRLEEQLRLKALNVPAATIEKLTVSQLIGLRFASDPELPGLAARAITEDLTRKQIKMAIINWRADNFRV